MARRTKSKKRTTKSKARPSKAKAKPRAKAKAKALQKKTRGRKAKGSELDQRWAEYSRCRTELEGACEEVKRAQEALSAALSLEQQKREVFEKAKGAFEQLLEVEPPTRRFGGRAQQHRPPKVVDIDRGEEAS